MNIPSQRHQDRDLPLEVLLDPTRLAEFERVRAALDGVDDHQVNRTP